ncbi:Fibrinogen- domains (FReDs) [Branchiostoma belcheri]|nr:Fibrinogen- domains (FReDs) [Branchiostoma belcheri]
MSSKKLVPNDEAVPEGSVGRHGNRWTNGILPALSGLPSVVGFVALLFMVREIAIMREQQTALMKEIRDIRDQQSAFQTDLREQQTALMKQQEDLKVQQMAIQTDLREELQAYLKDHVQQMQMKQEEAGDKGPASSTDDWRRDDSATFWKRAEMHRRSKRNSEAKTVLILGKRSDLGCLSGPPASDGPPQVTTPAAPTAPPQVTTPAPPIDPPVETDCDAYKAAGHTTSGVYTLGPPLSGVTVYCDMDTAGGGWTVIQRRIDGSVPFNRTWEEYKQGFGDKNGEYWLGNENIHLLTAQKDYKLQVDMMDWENQTRYAVYDVFRVAGESDGYRLTVSGYSGTAGDSMIGSHTLNGQKFSTVDRDNDVGLTHCSQHFGQGGWWFGHCGYSYLNGRYLGNCGISCPAAQGYVEGQSPDTVDPCVAYREFDGTHRSSTYQSAPGDPLLCDNALLTGWYRFNAREGGRISENCVPPYHCGTQVPIWMSGTHPTTEETVDREVCMNYGVPGDCCSAKMPIKTYIIYPGSHPRWASRRVSKRRGPWLARSRHTPSPPYAGHHMRKPSIIMIDIGRALILITQTP